MQAKDIIKSALHQLVSIATKSGYFKPLNSDQRSDNNEAARILAKRLGSVGDDAKFNPSDNTVAERLVYHDTDVSTLAELPGLTGKFLLPPRCSFLMSDFSHLHRLLETG